MLGIGNDLMGDDGAGPRVVALLRSGSTPSWLRAEDGGTDALRLPLIHRAEPRVVLVDALRAGGPPGTVRELGHDELLAIPQTHGGAHALSLPETLRWLLFAEPALAAVRFALVGIEPEIVAPRDSLSPAVEAAAREVADRLAAGRLPP